jgi:hypothetical protein
MATYSELQTQIERRVIDLPSAVTAEVPNLINRIIRELQKNHNFKVMEAEHAVSTTAESQSLGSVPSDFKEFRDFPYYREEVGRFRRMTIAAAKDGPGEYFGAEDEGYPMVLLDGLPSDVAGARTWTVYPIPDGNSDFDDGEYRIVVPYWKYLPALSADGDTNWFTVNGEAYIVDQVTSEAFFLDWDEQRAAVWAQKAAPFKNDLIKTDKLYRLSGVTELVPHFEGARTPRLRF